MNVPSTPEGDGVPVRDDHVPLRWKTTVPLGGAKLVWRARLVDALERGASPVISVVAPPGYGKTTALAQWAQTPGRPTAWLTLDRADDDPVHLVGGIVAALARGGIIDEPRALEWIARAGAALPAVVRSVGAAVEAAPPFRLVLDDVHLVDGRQAFDLIDAVARSMPDGSTLVVSGRAEARALTARRRAAGAILDVDAQALALDDAERRALFESLGVAATSERVAELVKQAEGWPAGLYLLGSSLAAGELSGAVDHEHLDRFVEDYLHEEYVARLPLELRRFLLRTSVLDRVCADLADALVGGAEGARMLGLLEESSLFIVPLDHERRWYRYHELLRGALLRELDRVEPGGRAGLLREASRWHEDHGLPLEAMRYALAAGAGERVSELFVSTAFPEYRSGRVATLEGWLDAFDEARLPRELPLLAVTGALLHALLGNAFQAERWLDMAEHAVGRSTGDGDGQVSAWIGTVEALLCRHGAERMHRDALDAVAMLHESSPLAPIANWLLGVSSVLVGEARAAEEQLGHALAVAEAQRAVVAIPIAAQLASFALDRGDGVRALELTEAVRGAAEPLDQHSLPVALLHVVEARAHVRAGNPDVAAEKIALAHRSRPALGHAIPHYAVLTLVQLCRTLCDAGDIEGARAVYVDASDVLAHRPQLGTAAADVVALRREIDTAAGNGPVAALGLTSAEIRLLPYLPTHLSFREIAERLFVSHNTVKTQVISVYRKLGASSRHEAVERAAELGLLGDSTAV